MLNRTRAATIAGTMLLLAACFVAVAAVAPQEPPAIEVVGRARVPSPALLEQVKKGEDEFLLFDVGYGVREAVVHLHEEWGWCEGERADGLLALLAAMQERWAAGRDGEVTATTNVAAVAHALLLPAALRDELPPAQQAELREVEGGAAGTLRFAAGSPAVDWREARPRGGYASAWDDGEMAGLFRATVYLRAYLARWPAATSAIWRDSAAACRAAGVAPELAMVEAALPILFGATMGEHGLPAPAPSVDLAWLRAHKDERATVHDKLAALFAAVPMSKPAAMSDGVLRLCHVLACAAATDPLFGAMPAEQWRAKWVGAGSFAYVGLREVDSLMRCVGRELLRKPPQVVIEPLPEVWEALRWLERRHDDLRTVRHPETDWHEHGSWVDPVLEALAIQQRGEDLPQKLHDRLREMLLWSFDAPDLLLGTTTELEGVAAPVRRAEPQLVRVPIRWRGETKKALALRLSVE